MFHTLQAPATKFLNILFRCNSVNGLSLANTPKSNSYKEKIKRVKQRKLGSITIFSLRCRIGNNQGKVPESYLCYQRLVSTYDLNKVNNFGLQHLSLFLGTSI